MIKYFELFVFGPLFTSWKSRGFFSSEELKRSFPYILYKICNFFNFPLTGLKFSKDYAFFLSYLPFDGMSLFPAKIIMQEERLFHFNHNGQPQSFYNYQNYFENDFAKNCSFSCCFWPIFMNFNKSSNLLDTCPNVKTDVFHYICLQLS